MADRDDDEPPSSRMHPRGHQLVDPRFAGGRLLVSLAVAVGATLLTPGSIPFRVRAVVGWDSGALVFVVLAWVLIVRATPQSTRERAALEDPGRRIVFFIAIASALFSLFAAVTVLHRIKTLDVDQLPVWTGLALAAVVLSWTVTHTAFTLRYAHLFYRKHAKAHCLGFPGDDPPCDVDFAYFAFTIGMCFQVSDVTVISRAARRVVLQHALVSFVYNTTILALALNLVTSMLT